jgi:hypothetical protein
VQGGYTVGRISSPQRRDRANEKEHVDRSN